MAVLSCASFPVSRIACLFWGAGLPAPSGVPDGRSGPEIGIGVVRSALPLGMEDLSPAVRVDPAPLPLRIDNARRLGRSRRPRPIDRAGTAAGPKQDGRDEAVQLVDRRSGEDASGQLCPTLRSE